VYCDCGVLLCVGMVYRIRAMCIVTVVCSCALVWGTVNWGVFFCEISVLLCDIMGYFILGCLGIVTVLCCCALV